MLSASDAYLCISMCISLYLCVSTPPLGSPPTPKAKTKPVVLIAVLIVVLIVLLANNKLIAVLIDTPFYVLLYVFDHCLS